MQPMHPDEQPTQQFATQPNMAAAASQASHTQAQAQPPSIYDLLEAAWRQLDALAVHLYAGHAAQLREAIAQNRLLMSVYQQRADQLAALEDSTLANVSPGLGPSQGR